MDQVLKAFDAIRVFQRGDKRAVHKPLLILLAIARLLRGEERLVEYSQIDQTLKALLKEFGPSSAASSRHYPFWHLASDGLWELDGPTEVLTRSAGATPTLGELRKHRVAGGFSPDIDRVLRTKPVVRQKIIRRILETHFPETLHSDILEVLGIELGEENESRQASLRDRARRDPNFRERVLRAYEYRCCVCGFDLRIGRIVAGLEAAHIKWFQANGPDIESNGLALCALHHKIFDLGAFTVLPSSYSIVFSQNAIAGESTRQTLLGHHGAGLILPQSRDYYPRAEFLAWHEDQVFKGPGRELT